MRRLPGRFQDSAVGIEQPPMVAAPQTMVRDDAEFERGAAVCAVPGQNADPATFVTECYQVLTENADCERHIGKLRREADRLPKATH